MPTGTILVMDDDPCMLALITAVLKPLGYWVVTAHDGVEGAVEARQVSPDIIISDLNMPEGNGLEVCERLRRLPQSKSRPVIFISGLPNAAQIIEKLAIPNCRFLPKPIDPKALTAAVSELLSVR